MRHLAPRLNGSEVAGLLIYDRRFGSTQGVGPVCAAIHFGSLNPRMHNSSILTSSQVRLIANSARKNASSMICRPHSEPVPERGPGRLRDLELNEPSCPPLYDRLAVFDAPGDADVFDTLADQITAPQLAIDGQIEHSEIASSVLILEPNRNRPNILRQERSLLANEALLVPRRPQMSAFSIEFGGHEDPPRPNAPAPAPPTWEPAIAS